MPNGFAGAGADGAGDHAVAIAAMRIEADAGAVVAADQYVRHGAASIGGHTIVANAS
jgi:hypothetical protein